MWFINCIPGPHFPGNSGDLAGTCLRIYRILCPCRPRTYVYPGLMWGDISVKRAANLLPLDVHIYAGTLTKSARGYGAGMYLGIYKKNPCSPGQYPGLYPWTSLSTKLNPRASPGYPRVVGAGYTVDSRINRCARILNRFSFINKIFQFYFIQTYMVKTCGEFKRIFALGHKFLTLQCMFSDFL